MAQVVASGDDDVVTSGCCDSALGEDVVVGSDSDPAIRDKSRSNKGIAVCIQDDISAVDLPIDVEQIASIDVNRASAVEVGTRGNQNVAIGVSGHAGGVDDVSIDRGGPGGLAALAECESTGQVDIAVDGDGVGSVNCVVGTFNRPGCYNSAGGRL